MGIVLDIVPNHMATDDANRFWADRDAARRSSSTSTRRPAATGASSTSTTWPAVRQEDPEVFDGHARAGAAAGARGRRRRAADRPSGRARRPGGLPRAAARRRRRARLGGEDPRPRRARCATGRSTGTVGYEFLNDVCALFVDPAGEAPLTDLWVEVSGDDRRFGELRVRGQARAGADDVRARGRAAAARGARSGSPGWSARWRRSRSTAPTSSRGRGASRTRTARRSPRRGLPASLARVLLLETPGWDAFVTRFQQTTPPVMAKGVEDTAFYRYARLLALNDVGGDPGALLAVASTRLPRGQRASARSASRATCSSPRRTTPSARATCARGSARWRRWPTSSRAHVRTLAVASAAR